ncbi:uncharacterized protein LOC132556366 [Ylistrum balloti]|uniref:uncharacterized protein LOC132556366 n=1 Tax=Ylistrum balloti TaxID=509963 RepID=UPI0029057DC9|nr:uncharacterized protein LOC132556366 [Ylistrum balloti]
MVVHARLHAGIFFTIAAVSFVTGFSQNPFWSGFLYRRQLVEDPNCSTINHVANTYRSGIRVFLNEEGNKLFRSTNTLITRERLHLSSENLCRNQANVWNETLRALNMCSAEREFFQNMTVLNGLCWTNGTFTPLLNELLDGFTAVNYYWGSVCGEEIVPVLSFCSMSRIPPARQKEASRSKNYNALKDLFKRLIEEEIRCINDGFGNGDDVRACGDVGSLKRFVTIIKLFDRNGFGMTFSPSNFGL